MANLPFIQGTVTVGTTATLVCSPGSGAGSLIVENTGSQAVILGGSNVTATGATAGISLAAGASVTFPTTGGPAHDLYAITSTSTTTVGFIYPV